jgi:hypothetical protein
MRLAKDAHDYEGVVTLEGRTTFWPPKGQFALTVGLSRCQKAGWKIHKKKCRLEVDLKAVDVDIAHSIVDCADDEARCRTLEHCAMEHWSVGEFEKAARYMEWNTDFLGCMERYRDQGRAMCRVNPEP